MRETPVKISCITVFEYDMRKTKTFSLCGYDNETSSMENFSNYIGTKRNCVFLGWNIKSIAYGPQILERRYNQLTCKNLPIFIDNWYDFDDILQRKYGANYISHPKLLRLAQVNHFTLEDFRRGEDEVELFNKGLHREIELSVNRKVNILVNIFELAISGKLRTDRVHEIFIVHGHDQISLNDLNKFLTEDMHLQTTILSKKPDEGLTIIEKFEKYANKATLAIVLLTPDDKINARDDQPEIKRRARQNVLLEMGYFFGILGRRHVILLYKEGVELPSDIYGILYKKFNDIKDIKKELIQEINNRLLQSA